jgi:hypothetical protein
MNLLKNESNYICSLYFSYFFLFSLMNFMIKIQSSILASIYSYYYLPQMIAIPKSPLNIRLIIFQLIVLILAPIWILQLIHYFTFPMTFLFESPSLIPQS